MKKYTEKQLEKVFNVLVENLNVNVSDKNKFILKHSLTQFPIETHINSFGIDVKLKRNFHGYHMSYRQESNTKKNIKIIEKVNTLLKTI